MVFAASSPERLPALRIVDADTIDPMRYGATQRAAAISHRRSRPRPPSCWRASGAGKPPVIDAG